MRTTLLSLLAAAALISVANAQTPPAPAPAAPAPAAPAPAAPPPAEAAPAPATPTAAAPTSGPANICAELVAFLTPEAPLEVATTAPSNAPPPEKPQPNASSAQQVTGQSGVAVEAPKEGAPGGPTGQGQNAPQASGIAAPIPKSAEPVKKKPTMTLEEGQALATANDIAGCQTAARKMRREGIGMPPALIALAALDLKYHQKVGAPAQPAPGATP